MPSLSAKDRVSLCQFTFADGRRCRTPRTGNNSRFCFDHAQKEARARAAENLGRDLDYFFSADYLSACDLSTALGRLIPAVIRGDVKPRTARTVAYLAQTLLQTIHLAKHEYINAFETDGWRNSIRNSVNDNYNHRFPQASKPAPAPAPESPQPPAPRSAAPNVGALNVAAGLQPGSVPATSHVQPAPPPHTPLPPTSAEFAQQVMAGLSRSVRPASTGQTDESQAPQPAEAPAGSHSDVAAQAGIYPDRVGRPEEPAFSSSPAPSPTSSPAPQTPASPSNPTASTTPRLHPIPQPNPHL